MKFPKSRGGSGAFVVSIYREENDDKGAQNKDERDRSVDEDEVIASGDLEASVKVLFGDWAKDKRDDHGDTGHVEFDHVKPEDPEEDG